MRNKTMILKRLKIGLHQCGQKYKMIILPQIFTTVMKLGFTFVHSQRVLCALKMKNSLAARSQKSALPFCLLLTWMVQTSYGHLSLENLLINTALEE